MSDICRAAALACIIFPYFNRSMDKRLGGDINAHIDYVADVKRLLDAG